MKDAVATFIAQHGVRRFEIGARVDLDALKFWLQDRGYEVKFTAARASARVKKAGAPGRYRSFSKTDFLRFVDELRVAEGLEPFTPIKGTGTFKSLGEALQGAFK